MELNMKYELGTDFLNETVKCSDDFSCLTGDSKCLCEAVSAIDNKLLFIKSEQYKSCNYKVSFGYSFFCHCPVRKELYRLYKV